MEKDFETVPLLDIYAGLLTDKQRRLCDMYYNQDYSLAEIADIEHTTRQAVRDGIAKARAKLNHFEDCLGVQSKRQRTLDTIEDACSVQDLEKMRNEIEKIWEAGHGI